MTVILIMGVAGSGKTKIGSLLAADLSWDFFDGDDFHPISNIRKMSAGLPLTDEDRYPWLDQLQVLISDLHAREKNGVLACSALKESYRQLLASGGEDLELVYLKATPKLIKARLADRKGHFMPMELINSQFRTLEEPASAITIPAEWSPGRIIKAIRSEIGI
jgi:gluconokinase